MAKHATPLLDQLESGPWPSFVSDLKQLAESRAANAKGLDYQIPSDAPEDLLGIMELSYEDKETHWKHGGIVGVFGYGGGGIGMTGNAAADAFKLMCLGANGVFVGKVLIQLLGCVGNEQGRCNSCNTGKCPMGICTQDPRLVKRLDIDKGAQKIVDYVLAFDSELKKLMAPIGNSSLPIGRSDALVSTDKAVADQLGIQYVC